jgi:LuxR family transcriptional regulator, maltose regulon positive regulatory protein
MTLAATPQGRSSAARPASPDERDGALASTLLRRDHLLDRLLSSPPARVVLLRAPAGYSKSTCLFEWARADERAFAWVACDGRHDDPSLLVTSIVEALEAVGPVAPEVLLALANPRPDFDAVVLPRLGESLAMWSEPFVLAVDDVHAIGSDDSIAVLEKLVGILPFGSQLALASRTEPRMQFGRMRAHRDLAELTQVDLTMTGPESAELLARIGIALDPEQVQLLFERTEGWPAALYLAGLALSGAPDMDAAVRAFAGDDRFVVDYLRDEFLAATDEETVAFLTSSSVLEELSGPLCDAALEREDSALMLDRLARTNALVIPLDRSGDTYRYHHLFAEMLRSRLRHRDPSSEREIHSKASRWHEGRLQVEPAIDHAIAAGEIDRAGTLIWQAFPAVSGRGGIATLERWLDLLGKGGVESSSELALTRAHIHMVLGDGDQGAHWGRVAAAIDEAGTAQIEADARLLAATLAADGIVEMGRDASSASDLLADESPWQTPGFLYRGVASHLAGHRDRAVPLLQEAARRGAIVSPIIQAIALAQLSLIAVEDEEWEQASRLVAQAEEQVERCGLADYACILIVFAASAMVRAHEGRVDRARTAMTRARELLPRLAGFPPWYETEARLMLVRATIRLDDLIGAAALLADSRRHLCRVPDSAILSGWYRDSAAALAEATAARPTRQYALTKAELRTLQHLPSHLTFREIGERVHVSPNTVKTQAQAIYRKLDVGSRAAAVEKARAEGLLGDEPLRSNRVM